MIYHFIWMLHRCRYLHNLCIYIYVCMYIYTLTFCCCSNLAFKVAVRCTITSIRWLFAYMFNSVQSHLNLALSMHLTTFHAFWKKSFCLTTRKILKEMTKQEQESLYLSFCFVEKIILETTNNITDEMEKADDITCIY